MAIPYQTTKFKSTNILAMVISGPTAKFNSHQYFWLYSTLNVKFQYNHVVFGIFFVAKYLVIVQKLLST